MARIAVQRLVLRERGGPLPALRCVSRNDIGIALLERRDARPRLDDHACSLVAEEVTREEAFGIPARRSRREFIRVTDTRWP